MGDAPQTRWRDAVKCRLLAALAAVLSFGCDPVDKGAIRGKARVVHHSVAMVFAVCDEETGNLVYYHTRAMAVVPGGCVNGR